MYVHRLLALGADQEINTMPFEQKYTPETREAALSRVLERRTSEPGNRSIIRETADEFQVGEQSLRGWIRVYEKTNAPAPVEEAAPVEPVVAEAAPAPAAAPATARRSPGRPSASVASDARLSELETEVAKLRRDREALKNALAVLLSE
jgi:transposase-like protein